MTTRPPRQYSALRVLGVLAAFSVGTVAYWHVSDPTPDTVGGSPPGTPPAATTAAAPEGTTTAPRPTTEPAPPPPAQLTGAAFVVAENARPGSPEWPIFDAAARPRGIEGFADRVSGLQGETVRMFANTAAPSFRMVAYRLGHYADVGARQVWASPDVPGIQQPACLSGGEYNMVDCSNWSTSLAVTIGPDWPPGQYLFKLIPSAGSATFVPFILRDDQRFSDVLVVSGVTTLLAYNTWGGSSFYSGDPHARMGSFDRPLDINWAQSGIVGDTFNVGMMLESMGLDVTYTTNVDQHLRPELMRNHRVVVSGWHDEYYSLEMRNGLEAARDSGVNVAFLGANAVFRRIRFEDSPLGPARRVVNHRLGILDPLAETDPEHVTAAWRDEPARRPESSLTGTIYECNAGTLVADMVIADGNAWMFQGTNVTSGQRWPGVVRQEYDRVNTAVPTPSNIQVLARSPLACGPGLSYSDMAYYTAPSGAGVFNSGTLHFETRLGPLCRPEELRPDMPDCQLRQMMGNIFRTFAQGPAGVTYPSQSNLDQLSHFVSVHPIGSGS